MAVGCSELPCRVVFIHLLREEEFSNSNSSGCLSALQRTLCSGHGWLGCRAMLSTWWLELDPAMLLREVHRCNLWCSFILREEEISNSNSSGCLPALQRALCSGHGWLGCRGMLSTRWLELHPVMLVREVHRCNLCDSAHTSAAAGTFADESHSGCACSMCCSTY